MNNRTLAATKYQLWERRTAVITFYIVLLLVFLCNIILNQVATVDPAELFGDLEENS